MNLPLYWPSASFSTVPTANENSTTMWTIGKPKPAFCEDGCGYSRPSSQPIEKHVFGRRIVAGITVDEAQMLSLHQLPHQVVAWGR